MSRQALPARAGDSGTLGRRLHFVHDKNLIGFKHRRTIAKVPLFVQDKFQLGECVELLSSGVVTQPDTTISLRQTALFSEIAKCSGKMETNRLYFIPISLYVAFAMICSLTHTSQTKFQASSRLGHRAAAVAKRLEALDLTCLVTASTLGFAVISALTMTALGTL